MGVEKLVSFLYVEIRNQLKLEPERVKYFHLHLKAHTPLKSLLEFFFFFFFFFFLSLLLYWTCKSDNGWVEGGKGVFFFLVGGLMGVMKELRDEATI